LLLEIVLVIFCEIQIKKLSPSYYVLSLRSKYLPRDLFSVFFPCAQAYLDIYADQEIKVKKNKAIPVTGLGGL
jgi:hypothetical protein